MTCRVLVLGAGGFVGRRLVAALAASSDFTPVAARHRRAVGTAAADTVSLDACDETALTAALARADAVVNCVAGSPATIEQGGRALFRVAARDPRRPQIVQLSSMAVYGGATGDLAEDAPLRADGSAYGAAKIAVERAAVDYGPVVLLRPGCIIGPGSDQWSGRIARLLVARRLGDLGAGGDGHANLVHVDNVVDAVLASLRRPPTVALACNLAADPVPRWNEYFELFAMALAATPVLRIGRRRLQLETRVLAPALKVAGLTLGRVGAFRHRLPDPVPPSLGRLFAQQIRLDSRRAEQLLGISWLPLPAGLPATVAWLRGEGAG